MGWKVVLQSMDGWYCVRFTVYVGADVGVEHEGSGQGAVGYQVVVGVIEQVVLSRRCCITESCAVVTVRPF